MSRIRAVNTGPELTLRHELHKRGFRFRLHRKDLPGKPDIVLPKFKAIIFMHGCFWHQHLACPAGRIPKSNREYWLPKLTRNVQRDRMHERALKAGGWRVLVVWECELKANSAEVIERVIDWLTANCIKPPGLAED